MNPYTTVNRFVWDSAATTEDGTESGSEGEMAELEDRCLCCGEGENVGGMCLACVNTDCNHTFHTACRRTGEVDPCGITDDNGIEEVLKQTM